MSRSPQKRFTAVLMSSFAVLCFASAVQAQRVDNGRGVDPGVDYSSLVRFGPWDDRNFQLTRADLATLAPKPGTTPTT